MRNAWTPLPPAILLGLLLAATFSGQPARADEPLRVGFAQADITPDVAKRRGVWLAGFNPGRQATGVHDPLRVRAVVLVDGTRKLALASVDLVGLMYPTVKRVRARLQDFHYVMVSSTHNHEAPDTIGLWGPTPFMSGVDPRYLDLVVARVVEAVRQAEDRAAPAEAAYGTAEDASLLGDSRLPKVKDPVLRVLTFTPPGGEKPLGLVVQWNCHPEAMGRHNTLVTADFCAFTVAALEERYGCPVAYFTGPVGGLMAPPDGVVKDAEGRPLSDGNFAYTEAYGRRVAELAAEAVGQARPLALRPFRVEAEEIMVPLKNRLYLVAMTLGMIDRQGWYWRGDPFRRGEPYRGHVAHRTPAIDTEVACLRLGELWVTCIPGEIYPELVYGKVADPPTKGVDFPGAPAEPGVLDLVPGDKHLIVGLANDEIGYLIPKRQWDRRPPYAYGRSRPQYGEINSVGPEAAGAVMQGLQRCARRAARAEAE